VRVVSPTPAPEACEPLAAYADLQADGSNAIDVDWLTGYETLADQTPGATLAI
jgi:hypothetical protein